MLFVVLAQYERKPAGKVPFGSSRVSVIHRTLTWTTGPGCTTTSQPIYCQDGRKSTSLVQLSPDALTSQISRVTTSAMRPTFWDSDGSNFSAVVARWHPTGATLVKGRRSGTLLCNTAQEGSFTCVRDHSCACVYTRQGAWSSCLPQSQPAEEGGVSPSG